MALPPQLLKTTHVHTKSVREEQAETGGGGVK